jgi:hypothetical protein
MSGSLEGGVHLAGISQNIGNMQKHWSSKEDNQNSTVHIREQERASFEALIHEI